MFHPILLFTLLLLPLASANAAQPIRLGLNYPSTGNYKSEGLELSRGALLAVDEINGRGGVLGRPLQLVSLNSAARAEKAEANIDRFASQGTVMVFGGANSEEALAAGQRARQLGLLYFPTLGYANEITGRDGHRHLFRESNSAWMSARVLGQYLAKQLPDKRYFYVTADYTWGNTTESSLRETTGTQDGARNPGLKVPFPGARMADYQNALTQAAQSDAEVLVLVLFGEDLVRAMRVAEELGLAGKVQIVAPNLTQGIIEDAIRIVEQHRDNTRVLRDAHAKAHGCVKAQVTVLQNLVPELRHGVLAEPGKTWQAWMRLSNGNAYPQFDSARDARGMAIKLLDVPKHILLPIILVLCVVGAFGLSSRLFDVWSILLFGLLGYGFVKAGMPVAPFIIGFILGPMAETNLRRGLMLSDGNFAAFVSNPIAATFLGLALAFVLWQLYSAVRPRSGAIAQALRT